MKTSSPSIVIVGGGPAGLALAAHLLDNGIQCRVLERRSREDLLGDTKSFYDMASSGIQALLRIANGKAAQPIFESALAYDQCAMYTGTHQTPLVNIQWKSRSLGLPMFNIRRASLLKSLCETVEQMDQDCIAFETTVELTDLEKGLVEVEGPAWKTKQTLQADLVVAADGMHSRTRKHLFGEGNGLRSDGIVACYATLPPLSPEEAKDFPKPNQGLGNSYSIMGMKADFMQFGVVNPTATIWYANFILDGTLYQRLPDVPDGFQGWLDVARDRCRNGGIPAIEALIARTQEEDMQVVMCYDREPLDSYHKGRVVLVGDAAHPFTPYAGLGCSQAMVDAFCLAEALLKDETIDSAVATYEDQRIQTANALMEESRQLCSTSLSWRIGFKIFEWIFWLGKIFGYHEHVADGFMTVDGKSLVNDIIPFPDDKAKMAYENRYQQALASLQSQLE